MAAPTTAPKLEELLAQLPATQRRAVDRRTDELIAEEMSLRELRKTLDLTQVDVAKALDKGQHEISRIEQRGDMLLSTLTRLVEAMGGELELVCRFRNRAPVRLVTPARGGKPPRDGTSRRRQSKRSTR
jgi:DNA-binding XRE family transcriptional regulator